LTKKLRWRVGVVALLHAGIAPPRTAALAWRERTQRRSARDFF
jgi:hypothetical protein